MERLFGGLRLRQQTCPSSPIDSTQESALSDEHTFTADQTAAATTAMRMALGKPPEQFGVAQFVAMISDEVQQLREAGHSDEDIAAIVRESTGSTLDAGDLAAHYAPPEARGWGGGHPA